MKARIVWGAVVIAILGALSTRFYFFGVKEHQAWHVFADSVPTGHLEWSWDQALIFDLPGNPSHIWLMEFADTLILSGLVERMDKWEAVPFQLLPNPFYHDLQYHSNIEGEIKFVDVAGRLVHSQSLASGYHLINFADRLPAGVYFYKIEGLPTGRIVKLR